MFDQMMSNGMFIHIDKLSMNALEESEMPFTMVIMLLVRICI